MGTLHSETLLGVALKAYLGLQREVALLLHSRKARIPREVVEGAEVEEAPEVEEQLAVGTLRYCFDCQTANQVRCFIRLGP